MKFIVASKELLEQIQLANKVITSKSNLTILECFKFEVKENRLFITASDLDNTFTTSVQILEADGQEKTFALDSSALLNWAKIIDPQPLTFEIDFDNNQVCIIKSNGSGNFSLYDVDSFPEIPKLKEEERKEIEISADILITGINYTLYAASNDEFRPMMIGIFVECKQDGITFVATDSHRLAKYHRNDVRFDSESSFILSKKSCEFLKNTIKKSQNTIKIEFDNRNAHIKFDYCTFICRFREGTFPNYNQAIPTDHPYILTSDTYSLLNSCNSVGTLTNKGTELIVLSASENLLEIFGQDFDYKMSGQEKIICDYHGDPFKIGFKSSNLGEILKIINSTNVIIKFSSPSRATLIVPAETENEYEDITMLIMPLMINDNDM